MTAGWILVSRLLNQFLKLKSPVLSTTNKEFKKAIYELEHPISQSKPSLDHSPVTPKAPIQEKKTERRNPSLSVPKVKKRLFREAFPGAALPAPPQCAPEVFPPAVAPVGNFCLTALYRFALQNYKDMDADQLKAYNHGLSRGVRALRGLYGEVKESGIGNGKAPLSSTTLDSLDGLRWTASSLSKSIILYKDQFSNKSSKKSTSEIKFHPIKESFFTTEWKDVYQKYQAAPGSSCHTWEKIVATLNLTELNQFTEKLFETLTGKVQAVYNGYSISSEAKIQAIKLIKTTDNQLSTFKADIELRSYFQNRSVTPPANMQILCAFADRFAALELAPPQIGMTLSI